MLDRTHSATAPVGVTTNTGGAGLGPPGRRGALVACAGVTLRSVATARGIEVEGAVRAEGVLDVRGTLGVDRDAPVGFSAIRVGFDPRHLRPADEVAALVETTERYCVILQTPGRGLEVTVDLG